MSKKSFEDQQADKFFREMYCGEGKNGKDKSKGWTEKLTEKWTARCYESHPGLKLVVPLTSQTGVGYTVYGGACGSPLVKDADIYVGLCDLTMKYHSRGYPWEAQPKVIDVCYPITDMAAPKDAKSFHQMIDWLQQQILVGKKVHIGCMGGHGRTGTVLAALTAQMTGMTDAIQYVRKNYCEKAVESSEQVRFLMKEFGVSKDTGYKEHTTKTYVSTWPAKTAVDDTYKEPKAVAFAGSKRTFHPVASPRCLWS